MQRILWLSLACLVISGCASINQMVDSSADCLSESEYRNASQHKMLQAPPGMTVPQQAQALRIPAVGPQAPDTGAACLESPPQMPVPIMLPVKPAAS